MLRFINNSRSRNKVEGTPKLKEINQAVIHICKIVQYSHFSEDLERLKSNKPCTSRISSLPPFLDDAGLVRVGGRIKIFHLPSAAKHPIILPKVYQTNLIIDFYHIKHLHLAPTFCKLLSFRSFGFCLPAVTFDIEFLSAYVTLNANPHYAHRKWETSHLQK